MSHETISDKKYDSIIKRLELKKEKPAKKKFIIIQIDSLPYSMLQKFFDKGSCKFMKHLVEKGGYEFQRYNCGLPSGTPAVQSGIMYGDNSMIPGFRFVDKKAKQVISCGNPLHVEQLETKYFSKKKGILEHGSSYSNHFSGGASRSILTMSTMTKTKRFKRIKEGDIWFMLLLNPLSALRTLYYALAEFLIETAEVLSYPFFRLIGKKKKGIYGVWIPFRRIFLDAILTEIITVGVLLDIRRKVPKIYINYLNYDDMAHMRGPNSLAAYFALRALDRRIKKICKKADDDYDIFIMSDHGHVEAVPFEEINGMTLAEYISKCAKVESFGISSAFEGRLSTARLVMNKTIDFLSYVSTPLRWIVSKFAYGVLRVLRPKKYPFSWEDKEQIFVSDSCCLANVYFNVSEERMDIREIDKKYPKLIKKMLANKSIGIIMVKDGDGFTLLHRSGKIFVNDAVKKEGKEFLKEYGDEEILISQLKEYNNVQFIGDLVLFGNYSDGAAVSFAQHVGAHGGIGGDMMWPFFISDTKHDLSKVRNARELHQIFKEYSQ